MKSTQDMAQNLETIARVARLIEECRMVDPRRQQEAPWFAMPACTKRERPARAIESADMVLAMKEEQR